VDFVMSREETKADREFEELLVRSETGLGAEVPLPANGNGAAPAPQRREPAGVR
jgi:hypothetical protein